MPPKPTPSMLAAMTFLAKQDPLLGRIIPTPAMRRAATQASRHGWTRSWRTNGKRVDMITAEGRKVLEGARTDRQQSRQ